MRTGDTTTLDPRIAARLADLALALVPVIEKEVERGEPADVALNVFFRAHKQYGARDRRFLGDLVFSYFRWKGWIQEIALPKACALAWALDARAPHPAGLALLQQGGLSPEAVTPAGKLPLAEKAVLAARWLSRQEPCALPGLVPRWVQNALVQPACVGRPEDSVESILHQCLAAFQQRPPTWLRIVRGFEATVRSALAREIPTVEPHPFLSSALFVPGSSSLARVSAGIRARFEIQDLASQCVGLACKPGAGESWWDACAGAGGKSLHLADLMGNRGRVLATDIRSNALRRLRDRAGKAGYTIIRTATDAPPAGSSFDGVLVDAPCSGLGTWSRNPDARWRTSGAVPTLRAKQQKKLLEKTVRHLKRGGRLVYAVCTLTRMETTEIADHFLELHPGFVLEAFSHPLTGRSTDGRAWVWPWEGPCDGMFIARFRRR